MACATRRGVTAGCGTTTATSCWWPSPPASSPISCCAEPLDPPTDHERALRGAFFVPGFRCTAAGAKPLRSRPGTIRKVPLCPGARMFSRDARIEGYDPELARSEEHTSELQSRENLVCRLLLE